MPPYLALVALAMPARAADPVFPTGSRVGLVAARRHGARAGRSRDSKTRDKKAAILISAMPAAAYSEIEKTAAAEVLKKQGFSVKEREPIQLSFGKGFLIIGRVMVDKMWYHKWLLAAPADDLTALVSVQLPERDNTYSDTVLRAALATLSLRATVPDAERLSLLPFTVGDLAGFHIDDVLPGRALMLVDVRTDQGSEALIRSFNARFLVAADPGGPTEPDDRPEFARLAFEQIAGDQGRPDHDVRAAAF